MNRKPAKKQSGTGRIERIEKRVKGLLSEMPTVQVNRGFMLGFGKGGGITTSPEFIAVRDIPFRVSQRKAAALEGITDKAERRAIRGAINREFHSLQRAAVEHAGKILRKARIRFTEVYKGTEIRIS